MKPSVRVLDSQRAQERFSTLPKSIERRQQLLIAAAQALTAFRRGTIGRINEAWSVFKDLVVSQAVSDVGKKWVPTLEYSVSRSLEPFRRQNSPVRS